MIRKILFFGFLALVSCKQAPVNTPDVNSKTITPSAKQKIDALAQKSEKQPAKSFDPELWTDITTISSTLRTDIRYATDNNFVDQVLYPCGKCYLRPEVAQALVRVHQKLQQQGKGIKVYDCYRPLDIQWKMWEIVPDPRYVSDPSKGSMHNRGAAVDLTIVDDQGNELAMGTDYDFFGKEAWPAYTDLPAEVLENRRLLRTMMSAEGFNGIRTEWWHFSHSGKSYPLSAAVWPCE